MPPPTLTVSIVTYHPDLSQLDTTLRKLSASMALAREAGLLRAVNLVLDEIGAAMKGKGVGA